MASGGDDGVFKIWDMRTFKRYVCWFTTIPSPFPSPPLTKSFLLISSDKNVTPTPVASFKWHAAPITSIEWHPTEESVLAVSGADDQISIWDLSVEPDTEEEGHNVISGKVEVPPQLLFLHQVGFLGAVECKMRCRHVIDFFSLFSTGSK